jgi:Ser/Thr protein kinase RdoA (MazF antagonist)
MVDFAFLKPDLVIRAVEAAWNISLDGTWTRFPSYVNRVYGLRGDDGAAYVVKFYRPGRWSIDAILEEHQFLQECSQAELPVVLPLTDEEGYTLQELDLTELHSPGEGESPFPELFFALFPLKAGRVFDIYGDEDYLRLGALLGRLHQIGRAASAESRITWTPEESRRQLEQLLSLEIIPPSVASSFKAVCEETLQAISPRFTGIPLHRVHGDCHRSNILERPGEGLMLIDFDDMLTAPAVQDLWLLLPGRLDETYRQWSLLVEGYSSFSSLPAGSDRLVEPLRFMRMLHYLLWTARQRGDAGFSDHFPGWGSGAFWQKELEDFRDQLQALGH